MNNNINENKNRFSVNCARRPFSIVRKVIVGLVFAVLFALVFAILVKLLWNGVMPVVFDLKTISFWQAFGIIILAKLIFGGIGHRATYPHPKDRRYFYEWARNGHYFGTDEISSRSPHKKWKYYKKFWRDEGKAAFEAYIDKIEKESKQ